MTKNIKSGFWALLLGLTVLWLLADTLLPEPFSYFSFRTVFIQLTGVLAIGTMSAGMLLAVRPKIVEHRLNGLDKMYRLHKWLGISALVFAVIHWWFAQGTKWMVGWGWLTRPARRGGPRPTLPPLQQWMADQRHFAESVGEWAFYAAVILIALALLKRFPYHLFRKTHKLIAVAYLVLAYHAAILIKPEYWAQPLGWVAGLLLFGGSVSGLIALAGRIGAAREVDGVFNALTYYPGVRVIEGMIGIERDWPGHRPGQFAFVTSNASEGPHPYTIASAWDPRAPALSFVVKESGDYTRGLHERLAVGMPVTVEGPYGCFTFEDGHPRQIWIGAGIGITPFIARMKHLAQRPNPQPVDLFHPTTDYDQTAIDKLTADAAAANVRLHLIVTPRDGRLTADRIRAAVPDWRKASIWFCGAADFGATLRKDFLQHGLAAADFHQELFQMR